MYLGQGDYVFGRFCLSVCQHHYSKCYEQIAMKFYGGVQDGNKNKGLNFGGDLTLAEICTLRVLHLVKVWL